MNKVFKEEIGERLEVYMVDMIIKSSEEELYDECLSCVFHIVQYYNARLNPEKCIFGFRSDKFLGFNFTERNKKANPNKFEGGRKAE